MPPSVRTSKSQSTTKASTSYSTGSRTQSRTGSTSYPYGVSYSQSTSLPHNGHRSVSRAGTIQRPRTPGAAIGGGEYQQIICAVNEGRGVSPTVGLAFINISTGEAVLSQISDNQFYVKTCHKLEVFEPTETLIVSTAGPPNQKSKMYSIIEENILGSKIVTVPRQYWSETAGLDYIQTLAFKEDVEAIKVALDGNYYSTCCFSAALKYIDLSLNLTFAFHSLRVKYQPSEGTMMIDLSTIRSLELIQNIQDSKSTDCLFGIMNHTLTPMGSRLLRSSILQPSTQGKDVLLPRYEALEELTSKEEMFFATRQGLRNFQDVDKLLTNLIIIPAEPSIHYAEQSINNILILKNFLQGIKPVHEALAGANSSLLVAISDLCREDRIEPTIFLIRTVINEDVTYQKSPLDLRNQRTYAVKSGINGLLDVARQTYKEATEDVYQHISEINQTHEMKAEARYDNSRKYYLRLAEFEFEDRELPGILINRYRHKGFIECQTLELVKFNQRIEDSHQEVVLMSDKTIQELLNNIRAEIPALFRVCESIAMLDMLASFGQLVTMNDYVRPELTDCLAIKSGRHPIREKIQTEKFVPNDVYATQQTRFQIITGCNMSGKSTYIRSIALMSVMAQVGCFVPARYASFPMIHQLFARVSMDDSIEANVSTFASEMRETAFILRNIDKKSLAIIDELGRGTSSRDGLAISLSISEALVETKAFVWFATHFTDLAKIMSERAGVVNMHLAVELSEGEKMVMLYKLSEGVIKEEHYGLALARVIDLPPLVLEVAESVSKTLKEHAAAKKKSSQAFAIAKKRKLVLSLRETLIQARDGPMEGRTLLDWLRKLQEEFVRRMDEIDNNGVGDGEGEEADDGVTVNDQEKEGKVQSGAEELEYAT